MDAKYDLTPDEQRAQLKMKIQQYKSRLHDVQIDIKMMAPQRTSKGGKQNILKDLQETRDNYVAALDVLHEELAALPPEEPTTGADNG